jgi:multicomponent Na+:H+ antiporter subunit E
LLKYGNTVKKKISLPDFFWRSILLVLLWGILTDGQPDSWIVGLVSVVIALTASLILLPSSLHGFSLTGLASFLVFFLGQSLKGGIQVALIALRPRLDLHPVVQLIHPRLPKGISRIILVATLNLLPGSLCISLSSENIRLHILDGRRSVEPEVRNVELHIACMLGLKLDKS